MENSKNNYPYIECSGITKSYGDKLVLDGFSCKFAHGQTSAVKGDSGCGKTTLLRIIAGLETADAGTVNGVLPSDISFLFQEDRLLPWLTAQKNVEAVIKNKSKLPLAKEILTALNLGDEKDLSSYPSELSGGMARRVAIARALAHLVANDCTVLILDEALRGLDKDNVDNTVNVIKRYSENKTVISVTHNPSALEEGAEILNFT